MSKSTPHWFGPNAGDKARGSGHPVMFGKPKLAKHFDPFPDGGGYPHRFLEWAFELLGVDDPMNVVHLCSGSVKTGITVDIRPERNPLVVADCRATPFLDNSVRWILADPPYSEDYAQNLYGTEKHYPTPGQIMKECSRILMTGGKAGLLHFQVPVIRKPMKILGVYGVTTGSGYAIRAFTVLEKSL